MAHQDFPQEIAALFVEKLATSPFIMIGLMDGRPPEPMSVKLDGTQPNTLFLFSARDNRIASGGEAMAQFVGKGHDFFASLSGTVSEDHDRTLFDRLWDKHVEAWFPNGKAAACLNRFDIHSAEMWETDVSITGRLKMMFGGRITPDETSSHAVTGSIG